MEKHAKGAGDEQETCNHVNTEHCLLMDWKKLKLKNKTTAINNNISYMKYICYCIITEATNKKLKNPNTIRFSFDLILINSMIILICIIYKYDGTCCFLIV